MIPEAIQALLHQLQAAGFEAYLVGGCVRDTLLGRPIHDWDLTTSARPEQVMGLFPHCAATGLKHGTVTVLHQGYAAEVTTYRADGVYINGRRPETVQFISSLSEDLRRRDFTVNAMAMDSAGKLVDPYGGQADLDAGLIRCVGRPEARFQEDALRMLRGIRFSAQMGFAIEDSTLSAMERCAPLCRSLSAERIRDEIEKTLLSDRPELVQAMVELGMLKGVGVEAAGSLLALRKTTPDRLARWAQLRRLVPQLDLSKLRLDNRSIRTCNLAAGLYADELSALQMKRLIAYTGWEVACCVAKMNGQLPLTEAIASSNDCVTLSQLAVKGDMLSAVEAKQVGRTLYRMLDYVLDHPDQNDAQTLLRLDWLK